MTLDAPVLKAKDAPDLGPFDWADPLRLSDQLAEDERMIAESARSYCQEKLQPRVIKAFSEEETDPEIFREMGEMGLLGTTIPELRCFWGRHVGHCRNGYINTRWKEWLC